MISYSHLAFLFAGLLHVSSALPQQPATTTVATPTFSLSSSAVASSSVSTATPSAATAVTASFPTFSPPISQAWCKSPIYCPGEILQAVQLAEVYTDSKTFVDKPTKENESVVVQAFQNNVRGNGTYAALINWLDTYFVGEGLDVVQANLTDFNENPSFLRNVVNPTLQGWLKIVNGYWRDLARRNVQTGNGTSSLIPLNHTFIVPGGRFRENYYWDTYWILTGLLAGGMTQTANSTIQNFMDLIAAYGFIPNGARIYYLDRSQQPLFTQMLYMYLNATNDLSFLPRALQLNDRELLWWDQNRTINITGPSGMVRNLHSYYVDNSAPRPESYAEDWVTVNGLINGTRLNLSTSLYSDLAAGAQSGMDYSAGRWARQPLANTNDSQANLRTLNINNQIPVDLNSILYRNYVLISSLYNITGNSSRSQYWAQRAASTREAILDVFWDNSSLVFRDWNMSANARANIWSSASYYPYWAKIHPPEVLASEASAQRAFSALGYLTAHYNSTIPNTLLDTKQQWDFPNSWPPEIYIAINALRNLPSNISSGSFDTFSQNVTSFSYLPSGHLGLQQSEVPPQTVLGDASRNITNVSTFGQLGNVGNLTGNNLSWRDGLAIAIANRYTTAAFCSWYSTGGSVPGLLSQLSDSDLNLTASVGNTGNMFEKFSAYDADQAGSGGEYEVARGFGWTNGVAVWIGQTFGQYLAFPQCPAIESIAASSRSSAVRMARRRDLRPSLSI